MIDMFIMRWKWLRAWRAVVINQKGELLVQQIYAESFNSRRFWWQKPLAVPQ